MFLKEIMGSIFDTRDQILERAKLKAMEDQWEATTYGEDMLNTIIGEFEGLNIEGFDGYIKGNVIHLSTSTLSFTKTVLTFLNDVLQLYTTEIHDTLTQCIKEIFKAQSIQFESLLKDPNLKQNKQFIYSNAEFVFGKVFTKVSNRLKGLTGHSLASLEPVHGMMDRLRKLQK